MLLATSSVEEERSWVTAGVVAWRVLGATINSVSEVSKSAGDAAGIVESSESAEKSAIVVSRRSRS
jgi:hypothetical protein